MECHQAPPSMGFSSKITGVGCHCLLQGISLTQGANSQGSHSKNSVVWHVYIYNIVVPESIREIYGLDKHKIAESLTIEINCLIERCQSAEILQAFVSSIVWAIPSLNVSL